MKQSSAVFLLYFLTIGLFSQSLDEDFLSSLPKDIISEIDQNLSTNTNEIQQKDYESFVSSIAKDEKNDVGKDLTVFGRSFFSSYASTFMPINDPAASSNYILDVDDLLFVQYLGDSDDAFEIRIDRAGNIILPEIGPLQIAGLSINDANQKLNEILSDSLINTSAVLSLREVRDINVIVTGFVENPGVYVASGYSNIIHILKIAGGIAPNGSYREILVKRKGDTLYTIDLYDIFIEGDTSSNFSLRSGDSVVVKSSNRFVPIVGATNRQAIFEFREGETVSNLLNFAGGVSIDANREMKFHLVRENQGQFKVFHQSISDGDNLTLQPRDKIFVKFKDYSSDDTFLTSDESFVADYVEVTGAVKFPGKYYVSQNENLSDLIEAFGGYKKDAYVFGAALFNEDAKLLEKEFNSRLYNDAVKSLANLGSISRTEDIDSLPVLLEQFKEISAQGRIVTEFSQEKLNANPESNYKLSPGDRIHVPYYKKVIYVFGETLNPGTYVYDETLSLTDYIMKSGGLNEYADSSSVIIVHPNGESQRVKVRKFGSTNADLYAGSVIYIPRNLKQIDGIEFTSVMAPIVSSLAISLASLNSISNN